jgi:hypothetical protein
MPRDYNPEDSDFTLWFAKKVSNLFAQHVNTLSSSDIEKAIKVFQNDGLIPLTTPTMVIKYYPHLELGETALVGTSSLINKQG